MRKLLGSKTAVSVLGPGAHLPRREVFCEIKQRAGVKDLLAPSESWIRTTRNGQSFGKYARSALTDEVNYRVLRTRKNRKTRYETINPDPYAKRTARRAAATPALPSNPVGPASRTPQEHARRPLEYPHLALPRAHRANAGRRFCRALGGNCPWPPLNLSPGQYPMYHQIHTYTELQQQIHDDLRIQHPEWVKSNGECPTCDSYESRLTEMLGALTRTGSNATRSK
jgi:hypothetical protein